MGKLIFRLAQAAVLLIANLISAQNSGTKSFSGQAVYETKSKAPSAPESDTKISPEMKKQIEEQLKRQLEKTFVLTFNTYESSWEEEQKLETPQPQTGLNVRIVNSGDGKRYNNIKTGRTLSEEDFLGKEFLISDELAHWNWTLTSETKKIGEYTCLKATAIVKVTEKQKANYEKRMAEKQKNPNRLIIIDEPKDYEITAWYAPDIPVGHGPGDFWGLPGLILEVNDGRRTILCSKIVLNPKAKVEIYQPKKGQKVTREEFDDIEQKKSMELQEMRQGKHPIRIGG